MLPCSLHSSLISHLKVASLEPGPSTPTPAAVVSRPPSVQRQIWAQGCRWRRNLPPVGPLGSWGTVPSDVPAAGLILLFVFCTRGVQGHGADGASNHFFTAHLPVNLCSMRSALESRSNQHIISIQVQEILPIIYFKMCAKHFQENMHITSKNVHKFVVEFAQNVK